MSQSWTFDSCINAPTSEGVTLQGFGFTIDLNDSGNVIAIGAAESDINGTNSGTTEIYDFCGSSWVQKGNSIHGEEKDRSGISVKLSGNGDIVAIGAYLNDAGGSVTNNRGNTKIYKYIDETWTQMGSNIDGSVAGDRSGSCIAMSKTGTLVAIGSPNANSNTGHVRVFESGGGINDDWVQRGNTLDGSATNYVFGTALDLVGPGDLTKSGNVLAVGAPGNNNLATGGYVVVYEWDTGTSNWEIRQQIAPSTVTGGKFGRALSLSQDGVFLAVGAFELDVSDGFGGTYNNAGQVRTYIYSESSGNYIDFGKKDSFQSGYGIDGPDSTVYFGRSVDIVSDTTFDITRDDPEITHIMLAIGGTGYFQGDNQGIVHVYDMSMVGSGDNIDRNTVQDNIWNLNGGAALDGEWFGRNSSDRYGSSVCLSSNASILAAGSYPTSSSGNNGYCLIHELRGDNYNKFSNLFSTNTDNLYKELRELKPKSGNVLDLGNFNVNSSATRKTLIDLIFSNNPVSESSQSNTFLTSASDLGLDSTFTKTNMIVIQPHISDDYANEFSISQPNEAHVVVSNDVDSNTGWFCNLGRDEDIKITSRTGNTFYVYRSMHSHGEELYEVLDENEGSTGDTVNSANITTTSSSYSTYSAFAEGDSATVYGEPLIFGSVGSNGSEDSSPPCFTDSCYILTPSGYKNVATLKRGDLVVTPDRRVVSIVRTVKIESNIPPRLIKKNLYGLNKPNKDTYLSDLHSYFDGKKRCVPRFEKLPIVKPSNTNNITTYYHIMLPNYHEDFVQVNNIITESWGGLSDPENL